jgi:hypothetical protein
VGHGVIQICLLKTFGFYLKSGVAAVDEGEKVRFKLIYAPGELHCPRTAVPQFLYLAEDLQH